MKTITLETTPGIDFEFHFQDGECVIDRCNGITPEDGLSLFPDWMLEILAKGGHGSLG